MYTDFDNFFTVRTRHLWRIKEILRLPPHPYSVTALRSKTYTTALLILMLHFRMCKVLNFTQNSFVLVSWLLYLFTTVLYDDTITS